MTALVLRIGPDELPDAERLCAQVALLPSVREGRRVVEIVPAAGPALSSPATTT
ncbi:hypothetical protein AB0L22_08615 [Micromonospora haikouensis]|uniref:hypothetical protein n=1 Tax=Micromonospora haikouensis TaxID=686309 RepID=UPI00342573E1